jgi:hypothetical protein
MANKVPNGKGFDIVIWSGKNMEAFAAAYTVSGREYLSKWKPEVALSVAYSLDYILPKDFLQEAPKELKIGGISPGARVPMLINPPLH